MEGSSLIRRLCAAAMVCIAPSVLAQTYTIGALGTLGGNYSGGYAVSMQGAIAGKSTTALGTMHAFVSDGVTMTDLGTFAATSGATSAATGVSATGEVVGSTTATAAGDTHGFCWTSASAGMQDLGTLAGAGTSVASGVNAGGQAVGYSTTAGGQTHAVLWQQTCGTAPMVPTDLGTLAGAAGTLSRAIAINNAPSPQIVGFSIASDNASYHAFVWQSGAMTDLGTLGGAISVPDAINDAGLVVGASTNGSGQRHAFSVQTGSGNAMQDLGTLVGSAGVLSEGYAVNSSGTIVGASVHNTTTTDTHAFIYQNGAMTDLNDLLPANSGWTLIDALSIDEAGDITGEGTYNGVSMAYVLVPTHFAFMTSTSNSVSGFSNVNGVLSRSGGAAATGSGPSGVTVTPSGRYVYVLDGGSRQISAYSSNAGALTAVGLFGINVSSKGAFAFALSRAANYGYVVSSGANTISTYSVSNGAWSATTNLVQTGSQPSAIALDTAGKYAYVANGGANSLWSYAIGSGGALTLVGSVASGNDPVSIAVTPSGQYVYAANRRDNTVTMYQSTSGTLTSLGTIAAGYHPSQIIVAPSGKYVYAMNAGGNSISCYSVDGATGKLSAVGTVATGNRPVAISMDWGGHHLYVANQSDGTAWTYTVGGNGSLQFSASTAGVSGVNGLAMQ